MNDKPHGQKGREKYGAFVPLVILAIIFVVMAGAQTFQLVSQSDIFNEYNENLEKAYSESRNVRTQLDSIAKGLGELAKKDNQNALEMLKQLKKVGITVEDKSIQNP